MCYNLKRKKVNNIHLYKECEAQLGTFAIYSKHKGLKVFCIFPAIIYKK